MSAEFDRWLCDQGAAMTAEDMDREREKRLAYEYNRKREESEQQYYKRVGQIVDKLEAPPTLRDRIWQKFWSVLGWN